MPAWSGSGKSSVPGLQTSAFLLCFHMVDRKKALVSLSLLIRALIPS